jgi:hypothetical protein
METSPKKKRFFHFPFFSCRNIVLLLFGAGRVTHIDRWKTKIRILSKSKQKGCTNTKKQVKKIRKKVQSSFCLRAKKIKNQFSNEKLLDVHSLSVN